MKTVLMVGAGANQAPLILRAQALGYRVVAVDGDPEASGLALADVGRVANILDGAAVLAVAKAERVDAVYPAAEPGVEAAAYTATALGLPGISPKTAECVRNKRAMRQALAAKGTPGPLFRGVRTAEAAREAVAAIGLPVIIKPSDGNASKGVTRVARVEDVDAAFGRAVERARNGEALVEEYLEGEEYNVDGLVYNGRYTLGGITAKDRSTPPHRFDLGIHMPPLLDETDQQAIADAVAEAFTAIGFENGTTHAEVIVTADGPRIVEMAGRPGGGRIPTDLIPLTYGVDFVRDSLRAALGEAPEERRRHARGAAVYWITAAPGRVVRIEGMEEAQATPGVREVVVSIRPGDRVDALIDCVTRDRIGFVLAAGEDAAAAVRAATTARDRIRVVTEADEDGASR